MTTVQIVLTEQQAGLLAAAADIAIKAHNADKIVTLTDEEVDEFKRLAVFLTAVSAEPDKFPVRPAFAKSIKKRARTMKAI